MKLLLPVALSLLTIACAAPKPGTAAHQRQLADEAREHFLALKEEERKSRPAPPIARTEAPAKVRLKHFEPAPKPSILDTLFAPPTDAVQPVARTKPAAKVKPIAQAKPTPKPFFWGGKPRPRPSDDTVTQLVTKPVPKAASKPFIWGGKPRPRPADDTVYLEEGTRRSEPNSKRYLAYKRKYADSLGKRPEDLSRKELAWVRTHYRD